MSGISNIEIKEEDDGSLLVSVTLSFDVLISLAKKGLHDAIKEAVDGYLDTEGAGDPTAGG